MRASFPFQLALHFIWNGGDVSPRPSRTLKATCFHSSAPGTSCRSWRVQSAVICHPTETYLEPQLFHKGTQHSDQERREVASVVAPHWTSLLCDGSFASRSLFLSIELPLEFCSARHCRKNLLAFSLFFSNVKQELQIDVLAWLVELYLIGPFEYNRQTVSPNPLSGFVCIFCSLVSRWIS